MESGWKYCNPENFKSTIDNLKLNDESLTKLYLNQSLNLPFDKMRKIKYALKENTTLNSLDIGTTSLAIKSAEILADIIENNIYIKNLYFTNLPFNNPGKILFINAIKKNRVLTSIHLKIYCRRNDYTGLGNALYNNPYLKNTLESLILNGCNVGFLDLCKFISISTTLRYLTLQRIELSTNHVDSLFSLTKLANSIKDNKIMKLLSLNLNNTRLGDDGAKILLDMIRTSNTSNTIQELNISSTCITHKSCELISNLIKDTKSLQILDLSHNKLGNDGIVYISIGFTGNKSIHTIDLERTDLTFTGAMLFGYYMLKNKTVQNINLKGNHIQIIGLRTMFKSITMNNYLKCLNLDNNNCIKDTDIFQIISDLKVNKGLTELSINCYQSESKGNQMDMNSIKNIYNALIDMLQFNKTLKKLTLMYTVKLGNHGASYGRCLVGHSPYIRLLLKRNQVIEHIAIMRIHRFWRDVCYSPTYAHARKRLCEGLEDPDSDSDLEDQDLEDQENSKKRSLESSDCDSPESKKPRIRISSS